ncbi:MAG: hypothetical protein PHC62_07145 [Candidatus Izemoplasmatales bacterium]|nr:hypothetical protein [Candidatus Izemoplasmatales bacterium]
MKKLNLQKLLDLKDISMTEFSSMVGIKRQSLYYILENMKRTEKYLDLFAEKLNINPDILNEFVENEPITTLTYEEKRYPIFKPEDVNLLIEDILADINFDE